MGEVDSAFIQDIEHRPNLAKIEVEGIPLIDLAVLNSPNSNTSSDELSSLVARIGDASKNWGFFQVINHGVPLECRHKIELASRKFFAQSTEEKRKVRRVEDNPLGYGDTEYTKNVRDWKELFDFSVENPMLIPSADDDGLVECINQWPEYPPDLREACEEYGVEMTKLSYKLLELISLSLELPADRLNSFFQNQTSYNRLNHYPPCPNPHLALGVGRHKDIGALTVLALDEVGGLEVKRKSDGEWVLVKSTPNDYIINIGDIIQVWSNDKYESVEHRVTVNTEKERFSIPFFFNPSYFIMVEPLNELINDQNRPKYKAHNWGKFFASRLHSNFKKLDVENLQICHFRLDQ